LRKALPSLPLSGIYRLLRKGQILVDGKPAHTGDRIKTGARVDIGVKCHLQRDAVTSAANGIMRHLPIILETSDLLILNKPKGLAVHGEDSLETQVRLYLADKIPPSLSFKPGPLHRLDQPTSGIIVFSKSLTGAHLFTALMKEKRLVKRYLALVDGCIGDSCFWEDTLVRDKSLHKTFPADTKPSDFAISAIAQTYIVPLAAVPPYTLISAEIRTGRTHQIRAQAALHNHPLAGDRKYGGSFQTGGFLLHAYSLEFPKNYGLPDTLYAPLPRDFQKRIEQFGMRHLEYGIPNAPFLHPLHLLSQ
jgi:23S rRNA pseudouridine955/2504/2580 synthase